ncbi:MAG: hypothetical protein ACFFBH_04860 [Promethearchaeota archaeon]
MKILKNWSDFIIQKDHFAINVGSKAIKIEDKFTLIKGKFKIDSIEQYKINNFAELCNHLEIIPLEIILNTLNGIKKKNELEKTSRLLKILNNQNKVINKNFEIVSQYIHILELLLLNLELNTLERKKETLNNEFEIAKTYKSSRDLYAFSDLLKKIRKSIEDNRKKASYLEKDYYIQKNQIDQIENNINDYNLKINELESEKKMYFSQINQISRLTENVSGNKEALKGLGIGVNLPNSEKIRILQLKAKELSYSIKQLKSQKEDLIRKLNAIYPKYEIYKNDYEKILFNIEQDDKKAKELQSELKDKLIEHDDNLKHGDLVNVNILRPLRQINDDIKKVDSQLNEILKSKMSIEDEKDQDLLSLKEKLKNISDTISKKGGTLTINNNKKAFLEALHSYRKFESTLNEIERIVNYFLPEIKLTSHFKITINELATEFFISTSFTKNDNVEYKFKELTTPERVYFIITLYLSICIVLKEKYIIFSNLFIPSDYNKTGSILRTFRKIIPIFKRIDFLSNFNLILILSNIEIKKEIEYVKIFEIKEN